MITRFTIGEMRSIRLHMILTLWCNRSYESMLLQTVVAVAHRVKKAGCLFVAKLTISHSD
jgi:hypothetical protein